MDHIKSIRLGEWECITPYDVKAFFTSVPVDLAISFIKQLQNRTSICIQNITTLMEFCLKIPTAYSRVSIMNRSMGSPISPIAVKLFMEKFETEAINTAPHQPRVWLRYVDDTFVILKAEHNQLFLQHINSIAPNVQFTAEFCNTSGSIPFMDNLVAPGPDNSLLTSVYRKPTHTDQYIHWNSHHNLYARYNVFNTLTHRARMVGTNAQLLHKEEEHVVRALVRS